jgi:hypothetical protein
VTKAEWNRTLADLRSLDRERSVKAIRRLNESADKSDLPRLRRLVVEGEDFYVREAAARPLARLDGARALPLLFEALNKGRRENHDNDGLDDTIVGLLQSFPRKVAPLLFRMSASTRDEDRANAAWALEFLAADSQEAAGEG